MSLIKERSLEILPQDKNYIATMEAFKDLKKEDLMVSSMDFDKVQISFLQSLRDQYMEETSKLKDEEQLLSLTDWCAAKMVLPHRENSDIKKSF